MTTDATTGNKSLSLHFVKSRLFEEEQRIFDRNCLTYTADAALVNDCQDS